MVFVLRSLDAYFECLQSVDYLLPAKTQARFEDSVWSFLKRYNWLNAWASRANLKRWHQVPTFHYLCHIALMSRVQNPRYNWNYPDEDFMGIMKKIATACTRGTPSHKVAGVVCHKWGLDMSFRMSS